MTGRYQAYPEYKESGVEWIKEIPSSWFISDLRRGIDFLTDFEANGSFSDVKKNVNLEAEGKYAWYLRATDLQSGRVGLTTGNRTVDEKAYLFLKKTALYGGELLVAKRGEIGKVYLVPELSCKATLAPNLYLIRLNQRLSPRFSLYWFLSSFGKPQLELANKSTTIGALYKDDVKACQILYPTSEEQQEIANFLDHETAKIDTLIAKQEKLIELLKEKRQAVFSHAVTKGITYKGQPEVPMKDSGVEWLGEVPEHWDVATLGMYATKIGSGKTPSGGADVYQESGVLFLRSQNIYDDGLRISGNEATYISDEIHNEMKNTKVKAHDILLNITGGSIGRTCIVPENIGEANVNQHVCILRFDKKITKYLSFVLKSSATKEQINVLQVGGNREGLNFEQIAKMKFCLPPTDEIVIINEFISNHLRKYQYLNTRALCAIELMKERKTALISAAVTGKIDVRDWQASSQPNGAQG